MAILNIAMPQPTSANRKSERPSISSAFASSDQRTDPTLAAIHSDWNALAQALGLSELASHHFRHDRVLVRAGVVFRILAIDEPVDQAGLAPLRGRLIVSLPLQVDALEPSHLLQLLQSNLLMSQTVGLMVAAGTLGELMLVGTLTVDQPHAMATWIDAAASLAQSILSTAATSTRSASPTPQP